MKLGALESSASQVTVNGVWSAVIVIGSTEQNAFGNGLVFTIRLALPKGFFPKNNIIIHW